MEAAFLVPNKGLAVRDPKTKEPLPALGEVKTMLGAEGRYWRRRLRDGAVQIKNKQSSAIPKAEKLRKKGKED